jgi:hypothetical protein
LQHRRFFGPELVNFIKSSCVPLVAYTGGNSFTLTTVSGKVLGAPKPGWSSEMKQGYAEFQQLPLSERQPAIESIPKHTDGRPPVPPKGLVLLVQSRALTTDADGNALAHPGVSQQTGGPQRDFLWLTEADAQALAPAEIKQGFQYKMPEPLLKRISRYYFIDRTIKGVLESPWPLEHYRAGELNLQVKEVTGDTCLVEMLGFAVLRDHAEVDKTNRRGEFHLYGTLTYNHKTKTFERIELAVVGCYVHGYVEDYLVKLGQERVVGLGFVFELSTPQSLGYGTMPWGLLRGWSNGRPNAPVVEAYFGSNPYGNSP